MDYEQALAFIHDTARLGSKLGLDNIRELMRRLGNPQREQNIIHVAGTNGKGSTVAFISAVLIAAGYRTGTFISPYLRRFNERIAVDGLAIPDNDLAALTELVKARADDMVADGLNHPTEFELVTAMAFVYYAWKCCDAVVLETGMGGRLDATNVVERPVLSVITSISRDHTRFLGDSPLDIAYEKAGIIKPGCDALVYEQNDDVMDVFRQVCGERRAPLWQAPMDSINLEQFGVDGQWFGMEGWERLRIRLLGDHQLKNAAMAVRAAQILRGKGFAISDDAIRHGLAEARWPGRFEVARAEPPVLLDAAHNEQGAMVLAENLGKYFPGQRFVFVVGVLEDKDFTAMMSWASPLARAFVTITPPSPRALPADRLADVINAMDGGASATPAESVDEALDMAVAMGGGLCVFGSLYFLDVARRYFGL